MVRRRGNNPLVRYMSSLTIHHRGRPTSWIIHPHVPQSDGPCVWSRWWVSSTLEPVLCFGGTRRVKEWVIMVEWFVQSSSVTLSDTFHGPYHGPCVLHKLWTVDNNKKTFTSHLGNSCLYSQVSTIDGVSEGRCIVYELPNDWMKLLSPLCSPYIKITHPIKGGPFFFCHLDTLNHV